MSQAVFVLGVQFLASLTELPKFIHSKLLKSLKLFARDRHHPSLHVEALKRKADGFFSMRIDKDYRLIFAELKAGHIQLIAAGKHDEAYAEAERLTGRRTIELREEVAEPVAVNSAILLRLVSPKGRKYLPLGQHLAVQPSSVNRLDLDFAQIILIIQDELPKSAYLYPAWWANDESHVQAAAWLGVGWKTADLQLGKRKVAFVRVR